MIAKFEYACKTYFTSAGTFSTSERTSIDLNKGEVLVIESSSVYSPKRLLTLMGCLIHLNEGIIEIYGKSCKQSNSKEIALIKSQNIGFIFRDSFLFNDLNVEENIAFPLKIQEVDADKIKQRTTDALKTVYMYEHRKKMPTQLTLFQQKQIAIAKAIIINPKIIICDKPTTFLDRENGEMIMKLLKELTKHGIAIAIINHDTRYNNYADRAVKVENGVISELSFI